MAGTEVELKEPLSARQRAELASQRWRAMPVEELAQIEDLPREWPALGRLRWALWLNAAVPGAGLIGLQRSAAGLAISGAFLVCAEMALVSLLVLPRTLGELGTYAACLAAAAWIAGQVMLLRRMGELQDTTLRVHASTRIEQARMAVEAQAWTEAAEMLGEAAAYDDEQPDMNWLLAKVHSATRSSDKAARQWRRLDQVDQRGRYQSEVRQALAGAGRRPSAQAKA